MGLCNNAGCQWGGKVEGAFCCNKSQVQIVMSKTSMQKEFRLSSMLDYKPKAVPCELGTNKFWETNESEF